MAHVLLLSADAACNAENELKVQRRFDRVLFEQRESFFDVADLVTFELGDRAALRDALRRGTISCIATDHAPHARHEKEVPFEEAPFGVTGLETAFAALYTHLVVPGELALETLLERMSAGPARAFGLEEPRIEVGARANLVALDLDAEWTVSEGGFRSLSANSWLLGERLRGKVVQTVADGRLVFAA